MLYLFIYLDLNNEKFITIGSFEKNTPAFAITFVELIKVKLHSIKERTQWSIKIHNCYVLVRNNGALVCNDNSDKI